MPNPDAVIATVVLPSELTLAGYEFLAAAVLALVLSAFFSLLRAGLVHSVPSRILERARPGRRPTLEPILERAEALATSASIFAIASQILFVVLVLGSLGREQTGWGSLGLALAISLPLLVFAGEVLPGALRGKPTDALLVRFLPTFHLLQLPLALFARLMEAARRGTMRLFRIPEKPRAARRVVEDLRDVIEDADFERELDETERELIENVVEFHDADVAEVMTPRTELCAVDSKSNVDEVVSTIAEHGHSRIPIFEGNLDTIIGVVYAQEIVELVSRGMLDKVNLADVVRPVPFVPETKRVSELFLEFRDQRQKIAVVLDEYGGTAGIVTLGDIVEELVGDIREEHGESSPEPIRALGDGAWEVQAITRISEVNEELELELPEEEDYETLAGFVLARLGHFPKRDESFVHEGVEFVVTEANDRRVFVVCLRLLSHKRAS